MTTESLGAGPLPPGAASPTLHELERAAPRFALRLVSAVLCLLVAVLLVWACAAQLDIVATAPGRLVPASQVKVVQAADAGIVREILVGEGDRVRAGQVLFRLDPTLAAAASEQVAAELSARRLVVRAIDAEVADRPFTPASDDAPVLFAQVRSQFGARRQALQDALAQEREAEARLRHERRAAQRQLEKLQQTLPVYQQAAASFARLLADGFVGELAANDRRREAVEREQDLKAQEATLEALAAALAQNERRQRQLLSGYRADLLRERADAFTAVQRLEQEQARAGFHASLLEVRAPQDGVVKDLGVLVSGAVVQAGSALLRIVPDADPLAAEAMLANEDIGFVEPGQRAKVKLAAYPFQKYGVVEGRVARISADAIDAVEAQRSIGATALLAYRATIALDSDRLMPPGAAPLGLAPGMAVTVEIHLGRRSVTEYLLSPVQRIAAEAGRER
jgi:HlyD family secretion protein